MATRHEVFTVHLWPGDSARDTFRGEVHHHASGRRETISTARELTAFVRQEAAPPARMDDTSWSDLISGAGRAMRYVEAEVERRVS